MPEAILTCLSAEDARIVADEFDRRDGMFNTICQDGDRVIVNYVDKRYALDVADYAFQAGHASDAETANTIARL
jgi:hypothetical protein